MQALECWNFVTNSMPAPGHIQQKGKNKSTMMIASAILAD